MRRMMLGSLDRRKVKAVNGEGKSDPDLERAVIGTAWQTVQTNITF